MSTRLELIAYLVALVLVLGGLFWVDRTVMGWAETERALRAALHPTDPSEPFQQDHPIIAARAAFVVREVAARTALGRCIDRPDLACARRQEAEAIDTFLAEQAVKSPDFAFAMAGLAAELGLQVPERWRQSYDPIAVATIPMHE